MQLLSLLKELSLHPDNSTKIKGLILDLAVKGKLTEKWRKDNPRVESAEILFSRVKLYNENLLKNKGRRIRINNTELDLQLDIPDSWIIVRNSDLFTLQKGTNPKDLAETVKKYPYQDIEALDRGNIRRYSDDEKAPKCSDDDILVVCDGSRSGLVLNGKVGIVGSTLAIIETPNFIQDYIKIIFLQDYERANANMIGAAIPHLDTKTLLNTEIGFPPLEEQKAIVEVVNQLFAEVEQLEALTKDRISLKEDFVTSALRRLTETDNTATEWNWLKDQFSTFFTEKSSVKKLRESILQLSVQGKLTAKWREEHPDVEPASELLKRIEAEKQQLIKEKKIKKEKPLPPIGEDEIPYELPMGWEYTRLGSYIHNFGQKTPDKPFDYIDVASIDNHLGIISSDLSTISPKEAPSRARKIVQKDCVIYSTVRPYLLNIACVDRDFEHEAIASTAFAVLNPLLGCSSKYLYYMLRSPFFIEYVESFMKGVAYPAINDANLLSGPIPIPPVKEQKVIVEKVNSLMALCDELEQQIETSHTQVEQLMQSCLKEVFQ